MDKSNNTYNCAMQLRCEPIECVRIGFVGLGVRAKRAVHRMMHIDGCKVVALCDLVDENINEAAAIVTESGHTAPATFTGKAPIGQVMPTLPSMPCSKANMWQPKCRPQQP